MTDLVEHVRCIVRCGSVDAETHAHAGVRERTERRDAAAESHVRRRAMRDAGLRRAESPDLGGRRMDGMREPHVVARPTQALRKFDRPATVAFETVPLLVERFGEMRV